MFNNHGNNLLKFNLEQGKKLISYNKSIFELTKPYLKLIERGSLVESMSNYNLSSTDKKSIEGLENIENSFNRTLVEYNELYKEFNEDLLNRNQAKKPIIDYLGKNVRTENGAIYYVNNFGYYYWYSPSAWNDGRPEGCPRDYTQLEGELPDELSKGPNVQTGMPCGMAGKVIKNTDNNEYAFIDIKGYKHIFPEGTEMNSSCAEMNVVDVPSKYYNLIPSGNSMSSTEQCLALDVNPGLWAKLQEINSKLKTQGQQLSTAVSQLNLENEDANNDVMQQQQNLQKYIDEIDDSNKKIIYNNRMLMQMSGEEEDSRLRMTSNYYQYLVWILLMVLILSLTMKSSLGKEGGSINPLTYLIVAIFSLIFIVYLYNRFKNIKVTY